MHELLTRRPATTPMALPNDPGSAAAIVTAVALAGSDSVDRGAAIDAMRARVEALLKPDSEQLFQELACHAVTLSALSQRWASSALSARTAENAHVFNRMSVACSTAYTRTLIALEGLRAQRKGRGRVDLRDDDSDQDDPDDSGMER